MSMQDIAVVILNYKMRAMVEDCVRSLYADAASAAITLCVVVVDNDSKDGLLEWLAQEFPQVHTVQMGANFGFAKSVNYGLRAVDAAYYFVLNPDTRMVEPHTLARLHAWMEAHPDVGMCVPRLVSKDGVQQYSYHRFPSLTVQLVRRSSCARVRWFKKRIDRFLLDDTDRSITRPVDWAQGSAMFVRATAFRDVGFFDERFWMYFEDCDWCRRFWRAQWPIYYVPDISVLHYHGRGSAAVPGLVKPLIKNKLAREHVKSWARYFWKWRHEPMRIW